MSEATEKDRAEAEKHIAARPFTIAGFSRMEVEFIQRGYRDAYLAGLLAERARGQDATVERVARYFEDVIYDPETAEIIRNEVAATLRKDGAK